MPDEKRSKRTRRAEKGAPTGAAPSATQPQGSTSSPAAASGGGETRSPAAQGELRQGKAAPAPGGALEFDPSIITEIAVREASGIEGVAELTGGWRTKGVQVGESTELGEEGYVLDLRIAVEYGVNCVALAETIRNRIASAIEQMTGRRTVAINVHVTGIREKGVREEHHEEGTPLGEEHGIDF